MFENCEVEICVKEATQFFKIHLHWDFKDEIAMLFTKEDKKQNLEFKMKYSFNLETLSK